MIHCTALPHRFPSLMCEVVLLFHLFLRSSLMLISRPIGWDCLVFPDWLAQAENFGTTILDEDGLLELIRTKPGKKSKYEIAAEAEVSTVSSVVWWCCCCCCCYGLPALNQNVLPSNMIRIVWP